MPLEAFDINVINEDKKEIYLYVDFEVFSAPNYLQRKYFIRLLDNLFKDVLKDEGYKVILLYGRGKKKEASVNNSRYAVDVLDASLDKIKEPVLQSNAADAVLSYWVAKKVVSDLKEIVEPKGIAKSKNPVYYIP